MKFVLLVGVLLSMSACSSKVLVKKDTCKEVYGGALLECEQVKKYK